MDQNVFFLFAQLNATEKQVGYSIMRYPHLKKKDYWIHMNKRSKYKKKIQTFKKKWFL
jgi:hypothetical protein